VAASGEPSLRYALLRGIVIVALFVGGVALFAPPPGPSSSVTSSVTSAASSAADVPSAACDVGERECRFAFDGDHGVALSLSPQPVQSAKPLVVQARFDGAASNPRVTFTGAAMSMPVTTLSFLPRGQGVFVARGALPVCTEAVMTWTARVDVDLDGEPHAATFAFVTRRGAADDARDGTDAGMVDAAGAAFADDEALVLLPAAPPVDMTLSSGPHAVTLSSLRGHVVLVAFGFTSCPDVCPTTLSSWAAARRALTPDERARVSGLFVSVDPARDSPEHVAAYVAHFDAAFVGATGTRAQVDAAARAFGAYYAVQATPGADAGPDYGVDHSVYTWLVDADGRVVARLPHAPSVEQTVGALRHFLSPRSP